MYAIKSLAINDLKLIIPNYVHFIWAFYESFNLLMNWNDLFQYNK